jgi:hypothetical protein
VNSQLFQEPVKPDRSKGNAVHQWFIEFVGIGALGPIAVSEMAGGLA